MDGWMDREEVDTVLHISVACGAPIPKGVAAKAPVSSGKGILFALGKWLCEENISL